MEKNLQITAEIAEISASNPQFDISWKALEQTRVMLHDKVCEALQYTRTRDEPDDWYVDKIGEHASKINIKLLHDTLKNNRFHYSRLYENIGNLEFFMRHNSLLYELPLRSHTLYTINEMCVVFKDLVNEITRRNNQWKKPFGMRSD